MWPSVISSLPDPQPTDRLNSPSHSGLHRSTNTAVEQLETFIGTSASAVGTLMYDIRSPLSDGGGHVQAANKGGTGQTTFAKGDLLVALSSSVVSKLAVGTDGQALVVDSAQQAGVKWGVPGASPVIRTYTTAGGGAGGSSFLGIWNRPSTLSYAVIEVVGGGGGGRSVSSDEHGAGGGGGGYARKIVAAANLPIAASIVCGRGGPSSVMGGTTRFGSVISATGGVGATSATEGGAGGAGNDGDLNIPGGSGDSGNGTSTTDQIGGRGGDSFMGFGGGALQNDNAGRAGGLYGGGGGGAAEDSSGDRAGGAGADGIVVITEY